MGCLKRIFLLAFLVCLCVCGMSCKKAAEQVVVESGKAPDFTLADLQGSSVRLSELRGKVVLLEFWATWCAPCRESVPEMNKVFERFRNRDFRLLGISVDKGTSALSEVRTFVNEHAIAYPVLLDTGSVNTAYGVSGIPVVVIIDKDGKVAKRHIGFVPGLADTLVKDLEELL